MQSHASRFSDPGAACGGHDRPAQPDAADDGTGSTAAQIEAAGGIREQQETAAAERHPIERVCDYPRPPRLESCALPLRVEALGRVLAEGDRSLRILETFHPPTLYLPPDALDLTMLQPAPGHSFCEWKGVARYFDVVLPAVDASPLQPRLRRLVRAVWQYPEPAPAYAALAGWYALYPGLMDACWLDGERVIPQPGGFYGGWITSWIAGPFKGDPSHPELI